MEKENDLRCGIFRHAVNRHTMIQVDPHATEQTIRVLLQTAEIFGCGMPFRVFTNGKVEKCGWNS